jgi:hypothetical protein
VDRCEIVSIAFARVRMVPKVTRLGIAGRNGDGAATVRPRRARVCVDPQRARPSEREIEGESVMSNRRPNRCRSVVTALPFLAALGLFLGLSALSARAAEEPKKEGKGNVSGTVTDKDGKAVEGVEVRLMKPRQRSSTGGSGGAGGGANGQAAINTPGAIRLAAPPPAIATATTDKDGKYTMNDVATGEYMVGVRDDAKKAYGRARVTVEDGKTATADIKCTDTPPQRRGGGGGGGTGGGSESK